MLLNQIAASDRFSGGRVEMEAEAYSSPGCQFSTSDIKKVLTLVRSRATEKGKDSVLAPHYADILYGDGGTPESSPTFYGAVICQAFFTASAISHR